MLAVRRTAQLRAPLLTRVAARSYHERIVDHYESPRNVGSLDKNDPEVGTGLVGAPACGDVMKLQMRVVDGKVEHAVFKVRPARARLLLIPGPSRAPLRPSIACASHPRPRPPSTSPAQTFGCGSAIASSSYATEWLKGKTLDECATIKNSDIAGHLKLPPVKLHCSMLAEDAVKMAIKDYKAKEEQRAKQDEQLSASA